MNDIGKIRAELDSMVAANTADCRSLAIRRGAALELALPVLEFQAREHDQYCESEWTIGGRCNCGHVDAVRRISQIAKILAPDAPTGAGRGKAK